MTDETRRARARQILEIVFGEGAAAYSETAYDHLTREDPPPEEPEKPAQETPA